MNFIIQVTQSNNDDAVPILAGEENIQVATVATEREGVGRPPHYPSRPLGVVYWRLPDTGLWQDC